MSEMPPAPRFPYVTVAATLATLFLFLGLVLLVYRSPSYLGEPPADPRPDGAAKLADVKARNQPVLDGSDPGVKMPVDAAAAELAARAAKAKDEGHEQGVLPYPVEPPPAADKKEKK